MTSEERPLAAEPGNSLAPYFKALFETFGPQRWWPARTRLEVILGAILTQHTSWKNAEIALRRLRKTSLLKWDNLLRCSFEKLRECVRPAGFFQQKARTIRNFAEWLDRRYSGSLGALFQNPDEAVRAELLSLSGIGPETADAILLYAGGKPFFVADGYTRRILARHGLIPRDADYDATQQFVHRHLAADPALFKEFHALLVETGKRFCQARAAQCAACPLERFLPPGGVSNEDHREARIPRAAPVAPRADRNMV